MCLSNPNPVFVSLKWGDDTIKRSKQFGLSALRFAKPLKPGMVLTVEPGIYFIPKLMDQWKAEKICDRFINYPLLEKYKSFGGIRIEDDVMVTKNGYRLLGKPIPKTIDDIETIIGDGKPIAKLIPHKKQNRLKYHPVLSEFQINYDPTEALSADEWGEIE